MLSSQKRNMNRGSYEKLSIRDSARSLKRYGSTQRHSVPKAASSYVKHIVCGTDTLQGLALKYEVTMEQIRIANKLFTTDSIFLRDCLLIPVSADTVLIDASPITVSNDAAIRTHAATDSEIDSDLNNFLGKIDASIASTKKVVQKVHRNSQFLADEEYIPECSTARSNNFTNNNRQDGSSLVVVKKHQDNKIKTSIRKLEEQNDELFEL